MPSAISTTMIEYQRSCLAMGTRFEVILRGDDDQHLEAVAVAVCEEIQRLDSVLSRFNAGSEIARINREAFEHPVRVDREVFALLERCEQARVLTGGYFDVTQRAALLLDADACTVKLTRAGAVIDPGAIGKGYALDCGREILSRFDVKSALLNGGTSSVLAIGESFRIHIRHPLAPETIVHRLELGNRALSCSAARHPGQTDSDVMNPLNGLAVVGDDVCVVLASTATDAEIYSTALLAMGREKAVQFLESQAEFRVHAVWIEGEDNKLWQLSP